MKQIRHRLETTPAYQAAYTLPKGKDRTRLLALAVVQQQESTQDVTHEGLEGGPNGIPSWYFTDRQSGRKCVAWKTGHYEEVPTSLVSHHSTL